MSSGDCDRDTGHMQTVCATPATRRQRLSAVRFRTWCGLFRDAARGPRRSSLSSRSRKGMPAGFPEFRVHADRGEAGDGVDLVEEEFSAGAFLEEEVDAGHAAQFERAKGLDREFLNRFDLRGS